MKSAVQLKTAILPSLITLPLICFVLLPRAQGVVPAPDGGYSGGNTAEGQSALLSLSSGGFNTAIGFLSLSGNTNGQFNTGVGAGTLFANTADQNTAIGAGALLSNTTGTQNTADGVFALFTNTAGSFNTATGFEALLSNTGGSDNSAFGSGALASNTDGTDNTATGLNALFFNTSGGDNTAIGGAALESNTIGAFNTAIGSQALQFTTGSGNIALGSFAGQNLTTGNNNIDIGNVGVAGESNTIRIGDPVNASTTTFIAGIRDITTGNANAIPVLIDSFSQLGTMSSSRRFKKEIKPMDKASEAILSLKPVAFHYKSDTKGTPQFGLIAEEVAAVNPDLVVRDKNGEIYTVRYDAVNAMLLNEFLKEHRKVEKLEAVLKALNTRLKEQEVKIEKVSAQLEASKPASQVVNNP
jgi:hypothetical protein